MKFVALVVFIHLCFPDVAFTFNKITNARIKRSPRLKVVEHLIDCVANKELGEIYGLTSEYCLQTGENLRLFPLKGVFGQFFEMAFFVLATFAVNRADWSWMRAEEDTDDKVWQEQIDNDVNLDDRSSSSGNRGRSTPSKDDKCPQCAGSGIFGIGSGKADECPLCNGSGQIAALRTKTPMLPIPRRVIDQFDRADDNF